MTCVESEIVFYYYQCSTRRKKCETKVMPAKGGMDEIGRFGREDRVSRDHEEGRGVEEWCRMTGRSEQQGLQVVVGGVAGEME